MQLIQVYDFVIPHSGIQVLCDARKPAFDERDLLVLFDALYFQFNYYMNPDRQDFNKAAAAYSMAYRIGTHCLKPHSP